MFDLKNVPTDAVLNSVEQNRYKHALFLTYSLDIPFFEMSILRPLVSRGCGNITVFGDAQRVSAEVLRLTEPALSSRDWALGRYYSLTPVHHSSAFHPKVILLVGDTLDLFIGSGNLEPGGMRGNLELFHRLECGTEDSDDTEVSDLVKDTWQYIKGRAAARVPRFVRLQLENLEEALPWITNEREEDSATQLVLGPEDNVVPLIREMIGNENVQTLYVLSPFFDADLEMLIELKSKLKPKRTVLLLQSETVSIPGDRLKKIAGVEAYELGDVGSRYAHAKLVIAECGRVSVMFAGSHNVSSQAFEGKNYEVSILKASKKDRFSDLLGVADAAKHSKRIDFSTMHVRFRSETPASDEHSKSLLIGAQVDGDRIEIETHKSLSDEYRLVPYSRGGPGEILAIAPTISETRMVFLLKNTVEAQKWIAVGVKSGEHYSLPVPLLQIKELIDQSRPTAEQRMKSRFDCGFPDLANVEEILKDFQSLLLESHRSSGAMKRKTVRSKKIEEKPKIRKLSYEDFILPWEPADGISPASKGARNDFDVMIHAIAAAVGGTKEPPAPLTTTEKTDLSIDRSLARNSEFATELPEEDLQLESQLGQPQDPVLGKTQRPEATVEKTKIPITANRDEPPREQLEWESNKRLRKTLQSIAEKYPEHLVSSSNTQEVFAFEKLDQATSTGHLITSMLGRHKRYGVDHLDLVAWDEWAEFHVELLHALSSSEHRLLERLPHSNGVFEYHIRMLERFGTYLAAAQTLSKSPHIEVNAKARMSIGLFRITKILGFDKTVPNRKQIVKNVTQFFGSAAPELPIPEVDWGAWISFIARIAQKDTQLRRRFETAGDVADSGEGAGELLIGDWIWWPHTDGHVAVVAEVGAGNVEAAYEPLSTKKLAPNYVIKLEAPGSSLSY